MKKIAFYLLLLVGLNQTLFAQAPNWLVKESDYQYTMTFVAKLNVDGKRLVNANDRVAAFVGNSCRGVSGVTYVVSEKNYYAFLTVFANQQGESISFILYDAAANKTSIVSKQIAFSVNEHRGNLFQSYSIAEPALNSESQIVSFKFMNITNLSSIINNGEVKINISESYPLNNLKPVFTLSKGANLFKNKVLQISGEVTESFVAAINYEVLSEDESNLKNFMVSVSQSVDPTLFYRKNAVCYAQGAIKVVSKKERTEVKVTSDGKTVATKKITNGEALFSELNAGSYIATIGNEFKVINILMKDK